MSTSHSTAVILLFVVPVRVKAENGVRSVTLRYFHGRNYFDRTRRRRRRPDGTDERDRTEVIERRRRSLHARARRSRIFPVHCTTFGKKKKKYPFEFNFIFPVQTSNGRTPTVNVPDSFTGYTSHTRYSRSDRIIFVFCSTTTAIRSVASKDEGALDLHCSRRGLLSFHSVRRTRSWPLATNVTTRFGCYYRWLYKHNFFVHHAVDTDMIFHSRVTRTK